MFSKGLLFEAAAIAPYLAFRLKGDFMKSFSGQLWLALLLACGLYAQAVPYELGIVAIFRNEAKNLREWIEYHRLAGVEHFWLTIMGAPTTGMKFSLHTLRKALWKFRISRLKFLPLPVQIDAYKDGLMRARGGSMGGAD